MMEGKAAHPSRGLALPPGGVHELATLRMLRELTRRLLAAHGRGSWLIVSSGEVVGLCSYLRAPDQVGSTPIGFGIALSRRRLGHATRAVAMLLREAQTDHAVRELTAKSAIKNQASQRVLEQNGFIATGEEIHPEDGKVMSWRRPVDACRT